jgi:acyl-CoA synthetase (AMP-forming)/AMP-acid ligase II
MLISDIVRRNADFFGDDDAVIVPGRARLSWRELDLRTNKLANALIGLGLGKGDRLAIFAPNCAEYIEFFFSCAKSGVVGAATNVRLADDEISTYLSYVEPRAILIHAELAGKARQWLAAVGSLEHVIGMGQGHGFAIDLEQLVDEASPADPGVALADSDIYQLGATSGTTGIPKGAILTHRNAIAAMLSWLAEIPVPERGTALQCIPFFFNPGGAAGLHPVMMKGGRIIVEPAFVPATFLRAVAEYAVTNTVLVPTMLQMIVDDPDFEHVDLSSLRGINTGGSPLSAALLQRGREVIGDRFYPIYGMAETYSCAAILRPENQFTKGTEQQVRQLSSVGKPMALTQLRVVDEIGNDVPHDASTGGEIWLSGDTVSAGYFRMPDETEKSRSGNWFKTGDVAVIDQDGFITIVDRIKDLIITGGINVFSIEVERVLLLHPEVAQAAVIGVPHPTWGEAIHAVVRRTEGSLLSEDELIAFAAERLADYKKPKSVQFVDALPMGITGKILKRDLRAQHG